MAKNYWHQFLPDQFFHIYNHASGDKNIFNSREDYEDFLLKYERYFSDVFQTVAFCLMPNHFHFLVITKGWEPKVKSAAAEDEFDSHVKDLFRRYFSSFALAYNFRNRTKGQLFLKKCKRVSFDRDERLAYLICYIHHNPIHHGFVSEYEDWKYSSYQLYQCEPTKVFVTQVTDCLGDDGTFRAAHERFRLEWKDVSTDS